VSVETLVILIESLDKEKFKCHLTSWPSNIACCFTRGCLCLYLDGSRAIMDCEYPGLLDRTKHYLKLTA